MCIRLGGGGGDGVGWGGVGFNWESLDFDCGVMI